MKYYYCIYDNELSESVTYEIDADSRREAQVVLIDKLACDYELSAEDLDNSFDTILDILADMDIMVSATVLKKL